MTVRVRIAPSPTGPVHVGNIRSALFNWLFARHNGGTFILRIDDTDVERSETVYERDIIDGLRWLGLNWDEGVEVGGPHGSYRQSDRFDRYREVAARLVADGFAYRDDRSPEVLDDLRARAQSEGRHPGSYIRRPEREATAGVVRLSIPPGEAVTFADIIRGDMRFEADSVDDFVILRSDGTPTYHLASTVDDLDYRVTHVIRGEDLLPSTPKHILLARAMGATPPTYAHLPLLFGPDGKKLSKRHGDTSLRAYREGGYLPEAMVNFLALLGWSLDAERSIFSIDEAIANFDLAKVSKNPAIFDLDKLSWLNGEYIRALPTAEFSRRARPDVEASLGRPLAADEWVTFERLAPLVQERTKRLTEVASQVSFLFAETVAYDPESWAKAIGPDSAPVLAEAADHLERLTAFDHTEIEQALRRILAERELSARAGLQPIRVAVTGSTVSPPLFESIAALGRERAVSRLREAAARAGGG